MKMNCENDVLSASVHMDFRGE